MAVDRIGGNSKVSRDEPSAGFMKLEKQAKADEAPRNAQVDNAAKMYEKQFLREMVKAMRGTTTFGEKPSMAEGIYRDELDDQYVEKWGDQGGIGLHDLIYNQVMERFFASKAGQALKGSGGTIPITDRDVSKVMRVKSGGEGGIPGQVPLRVEVKPSADGKPGKLMAPWDSEVVSNSRLEGGKTALTLAHGPGLRSTLVFQGTPSADATPGMRFEKGKAVGVLSPETHSFLWNLTRLQVAKDDETAPENYGQDGGPVR
jgi:flagellar protein FlgJ